MRSVDVEEDKRRTKAGISMIRIVVDLTVWELYDHLFLWRPLISMADIAVGLLAGTLYLAAASRKEREKYGNLEAFQGNKNRVFEDLSCNYARV